MKYTLIAYKPENKYSCRGDTEVYSAQLIREDNLTRNEVVNKIFELSKDPQYVNNISFLYSDCSFEEFHVFESTDENIEEFDDFYFIKEEARKLALDFNKDCKRKQEENWVKEREEKNQKELLKKKEEYEKLKSLFEGKI